MKKALLCGLLASAVSMSQTAMAEETYPSIYASVVYAESIGESQVGIYSFSATEYSRQTIAENMNLRATGGAVFVDGQYFTTRTDDFYGTIYVYHYIFDPYDFSQTPVFISGKLDEVATDMTCDPATGIIYGCFSAPDGFSFGTLSFDTKAATIERKDICHLDKEWNACAFGTDGILYAITKDGDLYSVDTDNGAMTLLGNLGITSEYNTSAAVDPRSGRFYYAVSNTANSAIYTIDTSACSATLLYELGDNEQLRGMYFPVPLAEDDAPAAPTGLEIDFPDGSLTGTVSFIASTATFAGTPSTGQLGYVITANGSEVASGQTACGQEENITVTLPKADSYEIAVILTNDAGPSPKAKTSAWIGNDIPRPLGTVTLSAADGKFNVTWPPVTAGVHNGYFNPDKVLYSVIRMPGNIAVAVKSADTSFSENIPETEDLTPFSYQVTVSYLDQDSEPVASNTIYRGNVTPPFSDDFSDADLFTAYTVADVNADNSTWRRGYSSGAQIYGSYYNALDDWLVTPGLKLCEGCTYTVSISAKADYTYSSSAPADLLEVKYGTAPTPDGLSSVLMQQTEMRYADGAKEFNLTLLPQETGTYYLGLHALSPTGTGGMTVSKITISAGLNVNAPAAPAISVSPDINGELKATIEITIPEKTVGGQPIGAIEKVTVTRDGVEFKEFIDNLVSGTNLSFNDTEADNGMHLYEAAVYNGSGKGAPASASAYIGLSLPEPPTDITVHETSVTGEVEISWPAVTKDVNGKNILPGKVSYSLYDLTTKEYLFEGEDRLSFTHQAIPAGQSQDFVEYAIFASTEAGANPNGTNSELTPAGEPYAMPYIEHFDGNDAGIMGNTVSAEYGASWRYAYAADVPDGDNSCLVFDCNGGDSGEFFTGKIHLSGQNPTLVFHYLDQPNVSETLTVFVNVGDGFQEIATVEFGKISNRAWLRHQISLGDFAGKDIRIKFAYERNTVNLQLDNIQIVDLPDHSLCVKSISAPRKVEAGAKAKIEVYIQNVGAKPVTESSIEFFRSEVVAESSPLPEIAPNEIIVASIEDETSVVSPEALAYHAVVTCPGDPETSDDISDVVTVTVVKPGYPAVETLSAEESNEGVILAWETPDLSISTMNVEDDVEGYTPFSIGLPESQVENDNVGDWTMINNNPEETSSPSGQHPNSFIPKAFMVFSASQAGLSANQYPSYLGHNGSDQYFLCSPVPWTTSDKWMISPELSGNSQTISFFAKSADWGTESFEILCSSTDRQTDSFTTLLSVSDVPNSEWKEYTASLPEGTKHFAIRCVSYNQFGLMIDDISFEAINKYSTFTILGYNIYRDLVKLNLEPVKSPGYVDTEAPDGYHVYNVTVVYSEGESRQSNDACISTSCIKTTPDDSISITGAVGEIVISGAAGTPATILSVDGKTIFRSASITGTLRIPVVAGIYIVNCGNATAKIIVH